MGRRSIAIVGIAASCAFVLLGLIALQAAFNRYSMHENSSMAPEIPGNSTVLGFRWAYDVHLWGLMLSGRRAPERGDIVIFRHPDRPAQPWMKRVIGLPGETLSIRDKRVYINGEPLDEPYTQFLDDSISPGPRDNMEPVEIPDWNYFVMGDNRDDSNDSRFWGLLPHGAIRGKVVSVLEP